MRLAKSRGAIRPSADETQPHDYVQRPAAGSLVPRTDTLLLRPDARHIDQIKPRVLPTAFLSRRSLL